MKILFAISILLSVFLPHLAKSEGTNRFIDRTGVFAIAGLNEKIQVSQESDMIQFRIRGTGPSRPLIHKESNWFIYTEDENHFWVHVGSGRLLLYSWQSPTRARIDEWTYPETGEVQLPKPVEQRIKK